MTKIWANSADSHVLEPADLWLQSLPSRLARRAPRAERGDKYEILYIDGERMDRQLNDFMDAMRPPGARDLDIRLKDLDQEGVWGQLAFPSMGFWTVKITDRELARETVRAWNDWAHAEILSKNKRVIPTACVSTADIGNAVAELERAAGLGFQAVFLPSQTRPGEEYALEAWEPFWAAAEGPASCSASTSAPAATPWCSAVPAAPSSTTWRRPIPACGWCRTWSRAAPWTATRVCAS